MKNTQTCFNCNDENPIFRLYCRNCKAILRNRVVNIDFWKTSWDLLESPMKSFVKLIQAEHKNFVIILTLMLSVKYFLLSFIIRNSLQINNYGIHDYPVSNYLLVLSSSVIVICFLSLIVKYYWKIFKITFRFRDVYTILIYSFLHLIILFPVLFVIEYALFGKYIFTFNPSPFIMKPMIALVISSIEGVFFLFSFILTIVGLYAQTRRMIFSIACGLLFIVFQIGIILCLPFMPFV